LLKIYFFFSFEIQNPLKQLSKSFRVEDNKFTISNLLIISIYFLYKIKIFNIFDKNKLFKMKKMKKFTQTLSSLCKN